MFSLLLYVHDWARMRQKKSRLNIYILLLTKWLFLLKFLNFFRDVLSCESERDQMSLLKNILFTLSVVTLYAFVQCDTISDDDITFMITPG